MVIQQITCDVIHCGCVLHTLIAKKVLDDVRHRKDHQNGAGRRGVLVDSEEINSNLVFTCQRASYRPAIRLVSQSVHRAEIPSNTDKDTVATVCLFGLDNLASHIHFEWSRQTPRAASCACRRASHLAVTCVIKGTLRETAAGYSLADAQTALPLVRRRLHSQPRQSRVGGESYILFSSRQASRLNFFRRFVTVSFPSRSRRVTNSFPIGEAGIIAAALTFATGCRQIFPEPVRFRKLRSAGHCRQPLNNTSD